MDSLKRICPDEAISIEALRKHISEISPNDEETFTRAMEALLRTRVDAFRGKADDAARCRALDDIFLEIIASIELSIPGNGQSAGRAMAPAYHAVQSVRDWDDIISVGHALVTLHITFRQQIHPVYKAWVAIMIDQMFAKLDRWGVDLKKILVKPRQALAGTLH